MSDVGRCRSCPARILWVVMAGSGKRNPLNCDPDPDRGNIALDEFGRGHAHGPGRAAELRAEGLDLYLSHFATCPGRARHRKR